MEIRPVFDSTIMILNRDRMPRIELVINDEARFVMREVTPAGTEVATLAQCRFLTTVIEVQDNELSEEEIVYREKLLDRATDKRELTVEEEWVLATRFIFSGLKLTMDDQIQLLAYADGVMTAPAVVFLYVVNEAGGLECFSNQFTHFVPSIESNIIGYRFDIEEDDEAVKILVDGEECFSINEELTEFVFVPVKEMKCSIEVVSANDRKKFKVLENYDLEEIQD